MLWRYLVVVALASWWGALTFYGMVVVPAGTEILGSADQGRVTQQVTRTLNLVGVAVIVLLFFDQRRSATRLRWVVWLVFTVCQGALFAIHVWLSGLLEIGTETPADYSHFYAVHRIYLFTTAAQWGAGLWLLWFVMLRIGGVEHQSARGRRMGFQARP